jgi:predicted transposase YbfD/YdcC
MGTQHAIVKKIIDAKADYILPVKGNQKGLQAEVHARCTHSVPDAVNTTVEKGHGRIETRKCEVFSKSFMVDEENTWKRMKSIISLTSTRELPGEETTKERYYISSLPPSADFNRYIREHWAVENSLHWTLDMVFREDEQRKRTKHATQNFAVVRKIALNLLKKDTGKESLVCKRLKAAWNKDYLIQLLKI